MLFFSESEQNRCGSNWVASSLIWDCSFHWKLREKKKKKQGTVGNCSELSAQIEYGLCSSVQHAVFAADKREGSIVNSRCTVFHETWRERQEDLDFVSVFVKDISCFPGLLFTTSQKSPDPRTRTQPCFPPTPPGARKAWQENLHHPSLSHPISPPFPLNRNPAKPCPALVSAAGFSVSADN